MGVPHEYSRLCSSGAGTPAKELQFWTRPLNPIIDSRGPGHAQVAVQDASTGDGSPTEASACGKAMCLAALQMWACGQHLLVRSGGADAP